MGDEIKETFLYLKTIKEYWSKAAEKADTHLYSKFYNSQLQKLYLAWQNEKEKSKSQSYDDMLRSVREAVCDKNSELKKHLQKKYTYAIIDEFQDTNQKQWDIFKTVFMEDKDHILIVVGDPKQSIYAFQGADVNVYSNAVKSIADNGGAACSLQTNYRSTNAMVEACNCLFKDFFDNNSNITFTDSKPSGKKNPAQYCSKEIKPFWIAGNPNNNTTEKDFAKITVQTIVDCCSFENGKTKLQVSTKDGLRNVGFHDFAILARSSSEFKETERALKKAGVPYLRYKDGNLFFGKECLQWIALINAITAKDFTSTNRRLLNEALFSDFFCISIDQVDNEKYDNPSCAERQLIIQWKQLAQQRKWAKLFEKIYADTDIENRLSSLDQMQSLSKIRQIGNYVLDYLYKNDSSLEDVSKHLSRLSNDSDSSMDEGDIVEKGTDFDCVQLMTIHASKGLEFPVVIVPAGLRARNNNVPQAFLYHDDKNNSKLSFSPYGKDLSIQEEDYERQRIYYVAYTRASSLLVLPFYDKWDPVTNKETGKLYSFLNKSISSLFEEENKKFIEEISDKGKTYKELQTDVQALLAENKKLKEKEKGSQSQKEISQDAQLAATKELSSKVPSLAIHKHSYSSLSHKKAVTEEMTENGGRADKEGADLQPLSLADYDASENPVSYNALPDSQGTCPLAAKAPYNFPKGARLGIALHEVFEKADFKTEENDENLQRLIRSCFEKQTLSIAADDPDGWLTYTSSILWNTLNAKLPEISGAAQTGNYFSLSQLADGDKISEAEFNMNADITAGASATATDLLKNYCNGFIDLVFKRNVNGKEVYSILDWKSDTFEADQYSDDALLKAHTDDRYSIQRVLYSYSLIKWLASFYSGKNETEIFENHFGGIYYAYVRGCQANTCSGIYARTWKNWQELESAFKKIMEAEHESR
jgi:exodeoxyribonuclease V beta subunit